LLLKDLLKELRESRGLNKQELANKVDISRSYISTIESGKVKKPTKKVLLKLAYAFDPDREENVYTQLLKSAGYEEKNSKEEFEEFILELNRSFKDDNVFDPSLISKMKYRVNKKDNSVVFLDKPYMDIMWLLEQEDFEIYLGYEEYEVLIDKNGKTYNKPLKLDEEDRINLLTQVSNFQGSLIATKQALRNKEEMKDLIKDTEEYELIFDLLNNQINDSNDFISRLASINKDREIFTAKEFHEEIEKAVEQQDALKLQRLVRMTTLKELKQYLSEQN
jgi:transcriptional regulator with XRE-family HTH domain